MAFGGFACGPVRSQVESHAAVAVTSRVLWWYMRQSKRALHFTSMSNSSHPPILFFLCKVDISTLNISPFQMYHVTAVIIRCMYVLGAVNICAVYQIFANK